MRGKHNVFSIDLHLLIELNSIVCHNALCGEIARFIGKDPFFRGFPIFFLVVALWFSSDSRQRRSRMLIGLLAACVATVLSVWIQHHLVTHVRPLLDPTLHLQNIHPDFDPDWHNFDSFPSDTATLFFSIVTVIFLEHRIAGGIAFIW